MALQFYLRGQKPHVTYIHTEFLLGAMGRLRFRRKKFKQIQLTILYFRKKERDDYCGWDEYCWLLVDSSPPNIGSGLAKFGLVWLLYSSSRRTKIGVEYVGDRTE